MGVAFATWNIWAGRGCYSDGTIPTGGVCWFEGSCDTINGNKSDADQYATAHCCWCCDGHSVILSQFFGPAG